jgi:GNAT superfamily N-acetyltransferase
MSLVPASQLSYVELADLFTRGYEGYFVPMHVDEAMMRFIVESWDIDLERSRVAPGEGVAILGVRGDRGYVSGLGVVEDARRKGLGRTLMEALLEDAPPVVTLEVIEENEPAIKLYESMGFERTRILEVWSLPEQAEAEARRVEPAPLGQDDLPWQRADESLPPDYERYEVEGGAILVKGGGVLQLASDSEDAAVALLSRGRPLHYVNVPEGDVASGALRRLGGQLTLRQFEMRLLR